MNNVFSLCFFLALILGTIPIYGQVYTMTRYSDDSGLPSRIVRDVMQDNQGFIWVAGNNGLYKFDGKTFFPYIASLKDTIGLRDNKINTVLQASDGKIWIGTPRGLHLLENDSIRYKRLIKNPSDTQEYILNIFEDASQNLWVGTHGGLFMVEKSNEVIHFLSENTNVAITEGVVWGVDQEKNGTLWVAGSDGPYILKPDKEFTFEKLHLEIAADINEAEKNFFEYQVYNDSLLLIPSSEGLLKGEVKNDTILQLTHFLDQEGRKAANFFIERAIIDKEKNIWLGTLKDGFKKYSILNGNLNEQDIIVKNGLLSMSGNTKSVFEDVQGNIWLANTNGLYKLSRNQGGITTFPPRFLNNCLNDVYGIYALVEDKGGHVWISTPTYLFRIKKSDILQGNCPEDYLVFEDKNMQFSRNLFIDSQYRLWIGAHDGLFVTQLNANHDPGKFYRYTTSHGLPHNSSYDIHEIDPNTFWIGNYAGLVKLKLDNGDLNTPEIQFYTSNVDRPNGLINSQANDIEQDVYGNIWIGTFSGVSRILDEQPPGVFENYTHTYNNFSGLSNNSIKKLFRDSKDRLWIATQRGLNLYDPEDNQFIQFGNDEGLPSEYVLSIQEDAKGTFWIGTTNGVINAQYDEFAQQLMDIQHYTSQNGLADNIPYRNAILIDADDNIFIGSREGISVFNQHKLTQAASDFNLAITSIESTQKRSAGFKPLKGQNLKDEIVLSHNENSVKINYAALDFADPTNNTYRHKFLPVNNQWITTGNSSQLTYYNLAPGDYELVLDGRNNQGAWSKAPLSIKLTIDPPFYNSSWAWALYGLAVALIFFVFYRWRVAKKVRQVRQESLLEKALLEERENLRQENAADFHDELGSKVTKISLYLTLAERSLKQHEDPIEWIAKIRDNIKGLSGGFRDLLWVIDPKKDSLGDTFLRLKDFGVELFNMDDINFKVHGFDQDHFNFTLNPQTKKQVVLIFKEAMTNCLKYSGSKQIDFSLSANGQFASLELKDHGKGFNVDKKSKGRGLKNMKARANKIDAELIITSTEKGTCVILNRIPHMSDRIQLQDA